MLKKIIMTFMVFCSLLGSQFSVCMLSTPPVSPTSPRKAFRENDLQVQEVTESLVFVGADKQNEKQKPDLKIEHSKEAQSVSCVSTVISLAAVFTTAVLWLTAK